jgi:hypothetical protein
MMRERLRACRGVPDVLAILSEVRSDGSLLSFAEYLFDDDGRVRRHAAWVLTKCSDDELLRLLPLQQRLTDLALQTDDSSLCRLTLHLLERMPMEKESMRTDLLDFCLSHMQLPNEFPGVQTLCMKIAHRACSAYPELTAEFRRILENWNEAYYTPAILGLRRKLLRP